MNQLSNNVIDFARYRRARDAARARTASGGHHQRLNLLTCHWRRDAASGRLICAWILGRGARDAQPPLRLSQANCRTPKT
jgi:hypothetical protein